MALLIIAMLSFTTLGQGVNVSAREYVVPTLGQNTLTPNKVAWGTVGPGQALIVHKQIGNWCKCYAHSTNNKPVDTSDSVEFLWLPRKTTTKILKQTFGHNCEYGYHNTTQNLNVQPAVKPTKSNCEIPSKFVRPEKLQEQGLWCIFCPKF